MTTEQIRELIYNEEFRSNLENIYPILKRNPPYLHFVKVREVKSPQRGTEESAGIDFFVPDQIKYLGLPGDQVKDDRLVITPHRSILIPSGIHVKIPKGWELTALNKSGVAVKKGLTVGACLIDSDYQGEIHIHLFNQGNQPVYIQGGEKIVQFKLAEVALVEPKDMKNIGVLYAEAKSSRGSGGFGSTGDGIEEIPGENDSEIGDTLSNARFD